MATQDTRGNLHARDGKFTEKQHTADEVTLTAPEVTLTPTQMRATLARQGADMFAGQVSEGIDRLAQQLRQLADDLEREKANVADYPVTTVGQVMRQVNVTVSNLNLHGLLDQANTIQQFKTAEAEAELQGRADQLDAYSHAIENARTVEYDSVSDEVHGVNARMVWDRDTLEAARKQYRGE